MSSMLQKIKSVMKEAIKKNDENTKMATRMVLGEVPRLNKLVGQEPTDSEITMIIRGLIKSERLTIEYSGQSSSPYLESLEALLPEMISRADILAFIDTIDMATLKNKMQIISIVKKHFGADKIDSEEVKNIVEGM